MYTYILTTLCMFQVEQAMASLGTVTSTDLGNMMGLIKTSAKGLPLDPKP